MIFGSMTGLWKGLKGFCGINKVIPNVYAQNDYNYDGPKTWENMIIRGPNPYSKTDKLLKDVLGQYENIDNRTLSKSYEDENGNWKINIKRVQQFANNKRDSLTMKVDTKISNRFTSYIHLGNKQRFGTKFVTENGMISGDVGIRQKLAEDTAENALYTSAQFKHPAMAVDAKCKFTNLNQPDARQFNMKLSNVFGREFNRFGAIVGFKLKLDNSDDFKWQNMCQSVTFGLVFPTIASQFTFKPNRDVGVFDAYWKVNDKFEVAISSKANWRSPEWISRDHELGVKYTHTGDLTCNLRTDFSGKVSAGLLLIEKSYKLGFCFQSNLRNLDEGNKVGCSFEF